MAAETITRRAIYDNPFMRFLNDPETEQLMTTQFPNLYSQYQQMTRGEHVPAALRRYSAAIQPEIDKARGRLTTDVSRRLGSRSGAARSSIYNKVGLPALQLKTKYAQELYDRARETGMAGQERMLNALASLQSRFPEVFLKLRQQDLLKRQIDIAEDQADDFGWGDLFDIGVRGYTSFFG